MSKPKGCNVALWLAEDLADEGGFVTLRVAIEGTLQTRLRSLSQEQISDLAESLEPGVFAELGCIADRVIQLGTEPSFSLEGEPGSAYVRAQNRAAPAALSAIRQFLPTPFEDFCAALLSALGATAHRVGGTGDGGVDFIATDLPVSSHSLAALRASRPIVIGQAKRYGDNSLITVTQLREFVGAAVLRAEEEKRSGPRTGLLTPVCFAFWTTSDFNSPAWAFAQRAGLWCLNGLALAQLALRVGLPLAETEVPDALRTK